jgi:putative membrane protein
MAKTAGSSGHLSAPATAQGFVPALVAREIVVRKKIVRGSWWQGFFVVCFCLAFGALFEPIEWWVAVVTGEVAEALLGTQGYVWDTQSDMAYALCGAVAAVVLPGRAHDRQMGAAPGK